jgi:fatty acid desaturase
MNGHDDRGPKGPPDGPPERPRSEPEIIPPGRESRDSRSNAWIWVADRDGMRRANVRMPSPFVIGIVIALVALVAAAIVLVVLGAVLIWIPVLLVVIGALLLAATIRQRWRRFRRWASGR